MIEIVFYSICLAIGIIVPILLIRLRYKDDEKTRNE